MSSHADRSGIVDPQLLLAVNLVGGPALKPREFVQHKPETAFGPDQTGSVLETDIQ